MKNSPTSETHEIPSACVNCGNSTVNWAIIDHPCHPGDEPLFICDDCYEELKKD